VKTLYYIAVLLGFQVFAMAQGNFNTSTDEFRVALIIGNSDYKIGPLANPVNDARSIARVLKAKGFEVMLYENIPDKDLMKIAIREFGKKLRMNRGVGLFYYAGHGVQVEGYNFLVPVQAEMASEAEVEYEAVDVGFVLAQMEGAANRVNIIILDACRNNPFARSFRSADRGLATINAPTGSLIAYATAPGSTASDGTGENGLYTEAFLKQLEQENLKIEEVFKNVRAEVIQKSGGQQIPWESSSLIGDFYFNKSSDFKETTTYYTPVQPQTAYIQPEIVKITWRANQQGYWVFMNGKDISNETTYTIDGQNLVVKHLPTDKYFLLRNYFTSLDGYERVADIIEGESRLVYTGNANTAYKSKPATPDVATSNKVLSDEVVEAKWKAKKGMYWIFIDGKEVSKETTNSWEGKDLRVTHTPTGKSFLLKDFNKCLDGKVRVVPEIK
jgi:hypothetical protein